MLGATRNKVFLMRYRGQECVLKEVVVIDDSTRKTFENEVHSTREGGVTKYSNHVHIW